MADFFWFTDAHWSRIEPLLPVNGKGARRVDDRRVLSGIVHALQSGGRWGDCPPVYGPKKTLYNRFVRWAKRGIWEGIFSTLAGAEDVPDRLFIDSTCIKVHRTAGGAKRRKVERMPMIRGIIGSRDGPWPMVSARHGAAETPRSMPSAT